MSIIRQVPEAADGTYWHVSTTFTAGGSEAAAVEPPWSAIYAEIGGTLYAAVSVPEPVLQDPMPVTAQEVFDAAGVSEKRGGRFDMTEDA